MNPSAYRPRAAALAFVSITAIASSVQATPPRATASAAPIPGRATRSPSAVRPAPAPPPAPVALQLGGLRIFVPIPRAAVVHAIARDAWPTLVRCAGPAPRVHGYANVELTEDTNGLRVHLDGPPVAHDAALARCIRDALGAVELPPYEATTPAVSVSFDLAFAMPPLGTPAGPRASRRR